MSPQRYLSARLVGPPYCRRGHVDRAPRCSADRDGGRPMLLPGALGGRRATIGVHLLTRPTRPSSNQGVRRAHAVPSRFRRDPTRDAGEGSRAVALRGSCPPPVRPSPSRSGVAPAWSADPKASPLGGADVVSGQRPDARDSSGVAFAAFVVTGGSGSSGGGHWPAGLGRSRRWWCVRGAGSRRGSRLSMPVGGRWTPSNFSTPAGGAQGPARSSALAYFAASSNGSSRCAQASRRARVAFHPRSKALEAQRAAVRMVGGSQPPPVDPCVQRDMAISLPLRVPSRRSNRWRGAP